MRAFFSVEYTDASISSHEHATKWNFEGIAALLRSRRVGTINWNERRIEAVRARWKEEENVTRGNHLALHVKGFVTYPVYSRDLIIRKKPAATGPVNILVSWSATQRDVNWIKVESYLTNKSFGVQVSCPHLSNLISATSKNSSNWITIWSPWPAFFFILVVNWIRTRLKSFKQCKFFFYVDVDFKTFKKVYFF